MAARTIQLSSNISEELLIEICQSADVIACECPGYLTRLLRQVRAFRRYTIECIDTFPIDAETHHWLDRQAEQVEQLLYQTVLELMQKEGLVNDSNQLLLDKLSERAQSIALRQISSI